MRRLELRGQSGGEGYQFRYARGRPRRDAPTRSIQGYGMGTDGKLSRRTALIASSVPWSSSLPGLEPVQLEDVRHDVRVLLSRETSRVLLGHRQTDSSEETVRRLIHPWLHLFTDESVGFVASGARSDEDVGASVGLSLRVHTVANGCLLCSSPHHAESPDRDGKGGCGKGKEKVRSGGPMFRNGAPTSRLGIHLRSFPVDERPRSEP